MKIKKQPIKKLVKKPPPKYWKYVVLFGAHVGLLLSVGPAKMLGVFLVEFKEEFNANSGVIGAITTLIYFLLAIAGLFASMLYKHYSCRLVSMVGGLIIGIGFILTSVARNVFHLFLFVDILAGIGIGLAGNPMVVVIAHYFDKQYATANGFAMAGVDVGLVVLPPLTDYISSAYGWRGALLILGAATLNVTAMGALFRPIPKIKEGIPDQEYDELNPVSADLPDDAENNDTITKHTEDQTDVILDDSDQITKAPVTEAVLENENFLNSRTTPNMVAFDTEELDTVSRIKIPVLQKVVNTLDLHIFKIPKFLVLMPVTMIVASANSAILAHIVARAISDGISPFFGSLLLSGIGATSMIARCTHGFIIDKEIMSASRLYTIALILGGVFTFLSLFCNSFPTFLTYTLFYGAVSGIFQCASIPIVKSTVPSRMLGGAVAWLFIFRGLGGFLGGLIAGTLFDATGNYTCSFIVIAGSFMTSALLMILFSYSKGRKKRRDSLMLSPVELHVRECTESMKKSHRNVPSYWKFAVVFGSHVGHLLSIGLLRSLGVFFVRFQGEFKASSGLMGTITTLPYPFLCIAGLAASMLCKRYSHRSVSMIGGVFMTVGLFLTSFSTNIFQLILCIDVLTGIGIGLAVNPCLLVVAQYFDEKYATANGLAMAGADTGMFILPPLAEYLSVRYGWRGAMVILSGICMHVIAMGALFRPNTKTKNISNNIGLQEHNLEDINTENKIKNDNDIYNTNDRYVDNSLNNGSPTESCTVYDAVPSEDAKQDETIDSVTQQKTHVSNIRRFLNSMDLPIFSISKYRFLLPITLIAGGANTGMVSHIVARGISEGVDPFAATFLLSGVGVTSMISRATHGMIIDRGIVSAVRLYTLALAIIGILTLLSLLCNSFATFLIYTVCFGMVSGICQCAFVPIVRASVPSRMLGGAIAWLNLFRGFGSLLGGYISGALYDATGNYNCSFAVVGGAFLISAVLMIGFSYSKGRKKRRESLMASRLEQPVILLEI
ncbi:uncharacterized protein [Antedon mediterranea]|uniref:uncharacterized protein n=1 Tax=Antedon mediterranea TaxID=105859 RepID=UPI003AF62F89